MELMIQHYGTVGMRDAPVQLGCTTVSSSSTLADIRKRIATDRSLRLPQGWSFIRAGGRIVSESQEGRVRLDELPFCLEGRLPIAVLPRGTILVDGRPEGAGISSQRRGLRCWEAPQSPVGSPRVAPLPTYEEAMTEESRGREAPFEEQAKPSGVRVVCSRQDGGEGIEGASSLGARRHAEEEARKIRSEAAENGSRRMGEDDAIPHELLQAKADAFHAAMEAEEVLRTAMEAEQVELQRMQRTRSHEEARIQQARRERKQEEKRRDKAKAQAKQYRESRNEPQPLRASSLVNDVEAGVKQQISEIRAIDDGMERKRRLKELRLRWHPDKNPLFHSLAVEVSKIINSELDNSIR